MKRAYDQQAREGPKPYAAFRRYCELGSGRSISQVGKTSGKRPGYERVLERWSSRFRWVERAAVYDADEHEHRRTEKAAEDHKERESAGRLTKYTPDRRARILQAIAGGNTHAVAAQYGGINADTFYEWVKRHPDFSEAVKKAETDREVALVAGIRTSKAWTAKAWLLERIYPERWGRRERHELVGEGGGPVRVQADTLSIEELNRLGINEQLALVRASIAAVRGRGRFAFEGKSSGDGGDGDGRAAESPGAPVRAE